MAKTKKKTRAAQAAEPAFAEIRRLRKALRLAATYMPSGPNLRKVTKVLNAPSITLQRRFEYQAYTAETFVMGMWSRLYMGRSKTEAMRVAKRHLREFGGRKRVCRLEAYRTILATVPA